MTLSRDHIANEGQGHPEKFLQKSLKEIEVNDVFPMRNSEAVIALLQLPDNGMKNAFSLDIKNVYFSIPCQKVCTAL